MDHATALANLLGIDECGPEELDALARAEKLAETPVVGLAAILLGRTNFSLESSAVETVVDLDDDPDLDDESDQL
jgi:hypothetical protein